jgi:RNA polymerase sigma-70 factor (ECF subfamily)
MACGGRKARAGARVRGGRSARAFEQLYLENEPLLYRYLARRLDPDAAEQTVAEVFALAWQRLPARDPAITVRTWLLGLAVERLATRRADELAWLRQLANPSIAAVTPCSHPHVAHALAQLDPIDRDMVTLHVWAGVSRETVALLTGVPAESVHGRIDRAHSFVRHHTGTLGNHPRNNGNHG